MCCPYGQDVKIQYRDRKPNRKKGHDYTLGRYFVTFCTYKKLCFLSRISGGELILEVPGQYIRDLIDNLPTTYRNWAIPYYVIMPNHLHLIAESNESEKSLSQLISYLKATASKLSLRQDANIHWQRSFHDKIIHTESDYTKALAYIKANPARWERDPYHPRNIDRKT